MHNVTIGQLRDLVSPSISFIAPIPERYRTFEPVYYRFLYLLGQALRPALSLELGTGGSGNSSVHLAAGAAPELVIGVDFAPPEPIAAYPNLRFIIGDTRHTADQIAALNIPLELLFIDSTHTVEHAAIEFNLYWPLLKSGGVLLADDIDMAGMWGFWDMVPGSKFHSPILHDTCGFGVAIKL